MTFNDIKMFTRLYKLIIIIVTFFAFRIEHYM